jgi:hypothetical protein
MNDGLPLSPEGLSANADGIRHLVSGAAERL